LSVNHHLKNTGSPPNYVGNYNFSALTSITAEQDTMPEPTHFSPNSPAGQAPTPDRRRHAHSASPKVLSKVEGLRDASPGAASTGIGR